MKETVFEVKNLHFTYPKSNEETLKGISFSVEKGSIFGLLGPSGAGKSTIQKILIKLIEGYDGTISYLGQDLKSYSKDYYEHIGVCFEMPVHFGKLSAIENLEYFSNLYQSHQDLEKLLQSVGLYDDKDKPVSAFSKGMKVRLNFIRALLNNPDVIFLDEPTNGLDPNNAQMIKNQILELKKQGKTIIITTHLMKDVEQLCDQVVFINHGKISEMSSVFDLKMKYGRKEVTITYFQDQALHTEVFPMAKLDQNQEFQNLLKNQTIETMHSGETSLDEIFILKAKEL